MMEQRIISMFREWLNWCEAQGFAGPIWFTSYGEHIEDRANMTYLVQLLQTAGIEAQYIALADLQIVPGEALYAVNQENGEMRQVIEILVRLYPLEYVASERDASGFPIGEALLELVESEKLAMMNPTQSMLSQSKGMLALIWSLFERNEWLVDRANLKKPLFNKQECADIERWLLPTYWSDEPFRRQNQRFVSKAFFGREGKGTLIHGEDQAHDSQSDELQYYQAQPKIYQQFQAMHELTINTEHGPYQGYLLTGVYVIGRKYAGILPRVGEQITGDLAYFCPACVRKYSK
jgi:glutathionylspermidine synthase